MHLSPTNIATALITLNLVAFAAFGIDKAKARAGARRIAEATLLWLAFLGGTPGAYAGRALFRHKTRKQPFCRQLHTIATLHLLALGAGLWWWVAAGQAAAEQQKPTPGPSQKWEGSRKQRRHHRHLLPNAQAGNAPLPPPATDPA